MALLRARHGDGDRSRGCRSVHCRWHEAYRGFGKPTSRRRQQAGRPTDEARELLALFGASPFIGVELTSWKARTLFQVTAVFDPQPTSGASALCNAAIALVRCATSDTLQWAPGVRICAMAVKTEVLLRILKSASIEEVQLRLIDIANQWAASGCLQEANRLLSVARETGDLSTFTIPLAAFRDSCGR